MPSKINEMVSATYITCAGINNPNASNTSPASPQYQVVKFPRTTLPGVFYPAPGAVAGVPEVPVTNIENGVTLDYTWTRGVSIFKGTRGCVGGEPCSVPVPSTPSGAWASGKAEAGDTLEVVQKLCQNQVSPPGNVVTIAECDKSSPTIRPPKVGDQKIDVIHRAIGAQLVAYSCPPGKFSGGRCSVGWTTRGTAHDSNVIYLYVAGFSTPSPILSGETIAVTQNLGPSCKRPPSLARVVTVD